MQINLIVQLKKKLSCIYSLRKPIIIFLFSFAIPFIAFAKEKQTWRTLLNPLHLNFSLGSGVNWYEKNIVGMHMYRQDGKYYLLQAEKPNEMCLMRTISQPYIFFKHYDDLASYISPNSGGQIIIKGVGAVLPITLSMHVDILKKVRIELGSILMINKIKILKFKQRDVLYPYQDPLGKNYKISYFIRLGLKLCENAAYTLLVKTQASYDFAYTYLSDTIATNRTTFPAIGLGLTLEKHISEYCSVFSSISYNIGNFTTLWDKEKNAGYVLAHRGVYLNFGITLNFPTLPRCPFERCMVEVKHRHGGNPYRGVFMLVGKNACDKRLYKK